MIKKILLSICALLSLFGARAQALPLLDIDLQLGMVMRAPAGTLQAGGGGLTPTTVNLKDDLNLGDHSDLAGRLKVKHGIPVLPNFYVHYLPMSFVGDKAVTSINYGGQTFTGTLHSELTMNATDIGLFYNVPFVKTATAGIIDPEIGLNARLLSFSGKLTGTVGGVPNTTQDKNASIPVPMVYLGLGIYPINLISLNAQIKALSIGGNSITEWGVEAGVHPIPVLYVAVGYSSQKMVIDSSDIKADIGFSGPYLALGASF